MLGAKRRDRRNPSIAWRLWMGGFPVRESYPLERLRRVAAELDGTLTELRRRLEDERDEEQLLRELLDGGRKGPVGHALKVLGPGAFTTFAYQLALVGTGQFNGYDYEPEGELTPGQIVERGLALEGARTDRLEGVEPWLAEGTEPSLKELSTIFAAGSFAAALARATPKAIDDARRVIAAIVSAIPAAGGLAARQHGAGAFGTALWPMVDSMTLDDQARFICVFVAGQNEELRLTVPNPDEIEDMAAAISDAIASERLAAELAQAVPALAPLLDPARIGAALREPGGRAALDDQIARVAEEHRPEINAWLAHDRS